MGPWHKIDNVFKAFSCQKLPIISQKPQLTDIVFTFIAKYTIQDICQHIRPASKI